MHQRSTKRNWSRLGDGTFAAFVKHAFGALSTGLLVVALSFLFNACSEQSPFESPKEESSTLHSPFEKGAEKVVEQDSTETASNLALSNELRLLNLGGGSYPQSSTLSLLWSSKLGGFLGGIMEVKNGSSFEVADGSLSLLKNILFRLVSQLTMKVDINNNKTLLTYTFGPSGSKFDPPAKAWFDWSDLNISRAKVYYIEADGSYTELKPEVIDYEKKRLLLNVHHFSRYAVGWVN